MKKHLVIADQHAHPNFSNERADWLGQLIKDTKPEVVINIGDAADLESLSAIDKGKRAAIGRNYQFDIDAHLEFQERLWEPLIGQKKKLPYRVFLIGNHEQRIEKHLEQFPEFEGKISLADLELSHFYDYIVYYDGMCPGTIELDGIHYAHYFVSGVKGQPIGGVHPADSLITNKLSSCTSGHLHLADWSIRPTASGDKLMGCFVGVYQDYDNNWSGAPIGSQWWRGVVLKHDVANGQYDPEFISLERLRKEYANKS